jgi:hypothetical protein
MIISQFNTKSPSAKMKEILRFSQKSGRRDLNSGPHGPEPCALAGLSHAPNVWIIIEAIPLDKCEYEEKMNKEVIV